MQPDGTVLFGAVFFTFMCMFFFVLAVTDTIQRRSDIRKRTIVDRAYGPSGAAPEREWETTSRSLRFRSFAENTALLATVERGRKAGEHETEKSKLQRSLVSAGFFGAHSALWFQAFRFCLLIGLPLGAASCADVFWPVAAAGHEKRADVRRRRDRLPAARTLSGAAAEGHARGMPRTAFPISWT